MGKRFAQRLHTNLRRIKGFKRSMIALYFKQFTDPKFMEGISQRNRRRLIKASLVAGLKFWHDNILPQHFTVSGQAKYPYGAFFKSNKKPENEPALVASGEFRDRVLKKPNIRGTYKGASIKYALGRPSSSTSKLDVFYQEYRKNPRAMMPETRNHIFHFMKGKHITFEKAVEEIIRKKYKRLNYNNKLKVRMKLGIKIFSSDDQIRVREFMDKFVREYYQNMGKSGFRKIKSLSEAA